MRTAPRKLFILTTILLACFVAPAAAQEEDSLNIFAQVLTEPSTDDLATMKKRGVIRALVTPSMTDFFVYKGEPKGLQVELLQQYENAVNKGLAKGKPRVRVAYIPVPFSRLIPSLIEGKGDIAAALLTMTPQREKEVHFVSGRRVEVSEIVVAGKQVEGLKTLEDLAGRRVYVLSGSSYAEHLRELNTRLARTMRAPIDIVEADPNLLSEDIIELVNAGAVDITVIDDYKARLWANVFPNAVLHDSLAVHAGGHLGWAVRKNNPALEESLNALLPKVRKGSLLGNVLLERYFSDTQWIKNPIDEAERKKLEEFIVLFKKYGDQYGFDWLAVAAQAYQESGLDHGVQSSVGAVGIMQVLPSTAEYVGITNVTELDGNIHAGVKYVSYLREKYFSDPAIREEDQFAFTWGAYNAGPTKVTKMRNRAKTMGLDPNRWFQNVEYAALAIVGRETVTYVANIYKYYVAYTLYRDLLTRKAAELQSLGGGAK
jgi:membrane-bound lytic murein transglycosylase MltF